MKDDLARSQILTSALNEGTEWIPVAAIDQKIFLTLTSGKVELNIAEEALADNLDTWKGGYINIDHDDGTKLKQFKIEEAKFKNGMLHHKVSSEAAKFIRQSATSGRSIEVQPLKIKENKVIAYKGLGLSVLFPPYKPACNAEMGCSSLLNESQNVISDIFSKLAEKVKLKSSINTEPGSDPNMDPNSEANDMEPQEIIKLTSALAKAETGQEAAEKEIVTLKSSLAEHELTEKTQSGELKVMTDKLKVYEDAEKVAAEKLTEDQWKTLKLSIPKGKIDTAETEAALKADFVKDPAGFNLKMVTFAAERENPKGASGSTHTSETTSEEAEDFKILELLED